MEDLPILPERAELGCEKLGFFLRVLARNSGHITCSVRWRACRSRLFGSVWARARGSRGFTASRSSRSDTAQTEVPMKLPVLVLLLSVGAIAACGGGSSMDQPEQDTVMGSGAALTAPDASMTPTPMMPMMQMMERKAR